MVAIKKYDVIDQSTGALDRSIFIDEAVYKGKKVEARYLDTGKDKIEIMTSRVRLTPYYFVLGESTQLGGVLATLCPQNKKKIHGMVDAIMVPCATKVF